MQPSNYGTDCFLWYSLYHKIEGIALIRHGTDNIASGPLPHHLVFFHAPRSKTIQGMVLLHQLRYSFVEMSKTVLLPVLVCNRQLRNSIILPFLRRMTRGLDYNNLAYPRKLGPAGASFVLARLAPS